MREIRQSGSEGGVPHSAASLPLSQGFPSRLGRRPRPTCPAQRLRIVFREAGEPSR
jgi:hypothetical protein